MNPVRLRAYIELLIVSAIWGTAAVVIKYTLSGFSPAVFLSYRFLIASVFAIIFFIFTGLKFLKNPKTLLILAVYGFLSTTVTLGLLFIGTDKTTSIDANLLSAVAPITIVIAGVIYLKEHVTRREKIGMAIAFVGTAITVIEPLFKNHNGWAGIEGNLLVLASVLVATVTAIWAKKIMRDDVDPLPLTNFSFVIGLVTTLPIALLTHSPSELYRLVAATPLPYHLGVFYMALISGTLAYYLWHRAEKSIEVSEVSLFAYLYPVFGIPLSILWLKESITVPFIIGAIIIAFGVAIAELKTQKLKVKTTTQN